MGRGLKGAFLVTTNDARTHARAQRAGWTVLFAVSHVLRAYAEVASATIYSFPGRLSWCVIEHTVTLELQLFLQVCRVGLIQYI